MLIDYFVCFAYFSCTFPCFTSTFRSRANSSSCREGKRCHNSNRRCATAYKYAADIPFTTFDKYTVISTSRSGVSSLAINRATECISGVHTTRSNTINDVDRLLRLALAYCHSNQIDSYLVEKVEAGSLMIVKKAAELHRRSIPIRIVIF